MAHVPHVFVEPPWTGDVLELEKDTRRHLERVLRRRPGDPLTYTDGAGVVGSGVLELTGLVRGDERQVAPAETQLTVAVSPPHSADRARMIVEKLGELGVTRLTWLDAAHGTGRSPSPKRSLAWAVAALQQSQGAHLLQIEGPVSPSGPWPEQTLLVASRDGLAPGEALGGASGDLVVLVGPEGGFAASEVPESAVPVSLGTRILRVETAAIVAAATLMLKR
jgi:RsmE family RNA methyltransferase